MLLAKCESTLVEHIRLLIFALVPSKVSQSCEGSGKQRVVWTVRLLLYWSYGVNEFLP